MQTLTAALRIAYAAAVYTYRARPSFRASLELAALAILAGLRWHTATGPMYLGQFAKMAAREAAKRA